MIKEYGNHYPSKEKAKEKSRKQKEIKKLQKMQEEREEGQIYVKSDIRRLTVLTKKIPTKKSILEAVKANKNLNAYRNITERQKSGYYVLKLTKKLKNGYNNEIIIECIQDKDIDNIKNL